MLWVIYTQKVIGYPRLPNRRKLFGRLQGASQDDRIGMVKLMITYEYLICEIYEIYEKLFQTVWDQVQIWFVKTNDKKSPHSVGEARLKI